MCLLQRLVNRRRPGGFVGGGGKLIDELANLAFRNRAHETIDRAALKKRIDCRDRLNLHLGSDLLSFIDVQFDELDFATGFGDDLFKDRC